MIELTKFHGLIFISLFCINSCAQTNTSKTVNFSTLFQVQGEFEEIRDELVEVIEDKGMVISFVSHAGKMLERTQSTSKIKGNVYEDAEILLFCKADLSHKLAASDVHTLVLCPQAISVYRLKSDPEIVYMSIRNAPENVVAYQAIFSLMTEIIEQVIEENE